MAMYRGFIVREFLREEVSRTTGEQQTYTTVLVHIMYALVDSMRSAPYSDTFAVIS
jgi:hypothetical protein